MMTEEVGSPTAGGREEKFALTSSRGFPQWLAATGGSIAFTTYQAGKLFLIGLRPDGRLSIFERTFPRCMGLAVSADGRSLALAMQDRIQRFDNVLPPGEGSPDGHDAIYAPHAAWVTGDLDVHDDGWGDDGRPVFVNTLFGCLATVSDGHSFRPVWQPPFVSKLAAEDRCHLNGVAMESGKPRYVTAVSRSDVADGWRDKRRDGGVVVDVDSNEIVAEGLSMPHSPRLHDGRLWLLDSGSGRFGFIAPSDGRFEEVALCPGYARGLAFAGNHAVVGLSLALRSEAAAHGVGVLAVCPAAVETPILDKGAVGGFVGRDYFLQGQGVKTAYDADRLASETLRAMARNKALLVKPRRAYASWLFARLAPGLMQRMSMRFVASQRAGQSRVAG
jgi:uncharacterized protein (TIGR03032 family)